MPFYDFSKDLPVARETEKEVANLLVKIYKGLEILDFEDTYKYDILATWNGKRFTVEVKEDFICEFTGNVGMEFSCRGHDSGIRTTESKYYLYKLHTKNYGIQYVIHKTSTLKKMIADKKYFRIVNGGDEGSDSMNYLFRYNTFIKDGVILNKYL